MTNKMMFGVLITVVGMVFAAFSYMYAVMNPWTWNSFDGLLGSFLGTGTLIPFVIGLIVMTVGLVICYREAYPKDK